MNACQSATELIPDQSVSDSLHPALTKALHHDRHSDRRAPGATNAQGTPSSVIDLFKAVIAAEVPPFDEYRPVMDARTVGSPSLKPDMGNGQSARGGPSPGEVALYPVGPEHDHRASKTLAVTGRCMLMRIVHGENADRSHEIELRSADVDVGTVLNQLKSNVFLLITKIGARSSKNCSHGQGGNWTSRIESGRGGQGTARAVKQDVMDISSDAFTALPSVSCRHRAAPDLKR